MKPIVLTDDQREQIEHDRFHHPAPQIQRRMEALRLAAHGMPQRDIAQLSGLSLASVQRRLAEFRSGGLEAVRKWDYRGKPSELRKHTESLKAYFRDHPVSTVAEARDIIEKKTGVRRSLTQVRLFLKKLWPRIPQSAGYPSES
jgi:transposase